MRPCPCRVLRSHWCPHPPSPGVSAWCGEERAGPPDGRCWRGPGRRANCRGTWSPSVLSAVVLASFSDPHPTAGHIPGRPGLSGPAELGPSSHTGHHHQHPKGAWGTGSRGRPRQSPAPPRGPPAAGPAWALGSHPWGPERQEHTPQERAQPRAPGPDPSGGLVASAGTRGPCEPSGRPDTVKLQMREKRQNPETSLRPWRRKAPRAVSASGPFQGCSACPRERGAHRPCLPKDHPRGLPKGRRQV